MSDPITFYVGEESKAKAFTIHKSEFIDVRFQVADHLADFVCQISPVWGKVLSGLFLEGQSSTCDLSDVNPRIFQLLIRWIYTCDLGIEPSLTLESLLIEHPNKRMRLQNEMDDQDMDLACL